MLTLSTSQRESLESAVRAYQSVLGESPAVEYLKSRKLTSDSARYFRLGYVADPLPGHERYIGHLAIPYLTPAGVVSIRFRTLPGSTGPKYLSMPDDPPRLFNALALHRPGRRIAIFEGEFDTMTAHQAGVTAVGVPGATAWRPEMGRCFAGYDEVLMAADADDSGEGLKLAGKIRGDVRGLRTVAMPDGHDVNSLTVEAGASALLDRLGWA